MLKNNSVASILYVLFNFFYLEYIILKHLKNWKKKHINYEKSTNLFKKKE